MKQKILDGLQYIQSIDFMTKVKPMFILIFSLLLISITTLIIFRNQSIRIAYQISALASEIESKSLIYENLQSKYSTTVRKEILINKGYERGFILIDPSRIFYVK